MGFIKLIKHKKDTVRVSIKRSFALEKYIHDSDSLILQNNIATYTAECIDNILKSINGSINSIVSCDEFNSGSDGSSGRRYNKKYGFCGGSSSGSLYSVRENISDIAICTDTGGSARQPALTCFDVVGFKPTQHLFSRHGVMPLSQTLDCVSFICKRNNLFLIENILKNLKNANYQLDQNAKSVNLKKTELSRIDMNYHQFLNYFGLAEKEILEIYDHITSAELFTNLARYDGKIGMPNQESNILKHWKKYLHPQTFKRIMRGRIYAWELYWKSMKKLDNIRNKDYDLRGKVIVVSTEGLINEDQPCRLDPVLLISNFLGLPSCALNNKIYMSHKYSDVSLIKFLQNV